VEKAEPTQPLQKFKALHYNRPTKMILADKACWGRTPVHFSGASFYGRLLALPRILLLGCKDLPWTYHVAFHFKGIGLALPPNITPWFEKGFRGTNTPAYFALRWWRQKTHFILLNLGVLFG
jgi:hypothetical protein